MSETQLQTGAGAAIFVNVRPNAVSITVDEETVYTFDRAGRLITAVIEDRTYRRGLDNRILVKWREGAPASQVACRRLLNNEECRHVVERVQRDVNAALSAWRQSGLGARSAIANVESSCSATRLLQRIADMGWNALVADAGKFSGVYRTISILPPDQYLALVLQATEGCSFNRCVFCSFYRERPFRIKNPAEFREHMDSVLRFFGEGISLRRSVFLADANAVCIPRDDLLRMLDDLNARMPMRPLVAGGSIDGICSFVDAFSVRDGGVRKYSEMRQRDVRRLYLGVETGCRELLKFLHKPQTPEDVRETIFEIKEGGLNVGIILMIGIGGDKFATRHVGETLELMNSLPLGTNDLVFLSSFREQSELEYHQLAQAAGIQPLSNAELDHQSHALREGIRNGHPGLRTASYGIDEFLY